MPQLKPVQRPGNHRPAELDSLVGEFQWIISNQGMRYKMVLPYSAVSRIKFREIPDTTQSLIDPTNETVTNPQTAISLLNQAIRNPNSKGEVSIHVYDPPRYYFQTDDGNWKEIEDFSENRSASNSHVHVISGTFVTLFCQLRILLSTCSRLKVAADSLLGLWIGSMEDPYGAIPGIPTNTWTPCGNAVTMQTAARTGNGHHHMSGPSDATAVEQLHGSGGLGMYVPPVSAGSSTIGNLTPTPTSMGAHQQ
ncbi:hypothetical protein EC988_009496, partial [Linderina pennispora]